MRERLARINWAMVVAGLLATLIVVTMFINAVAGAQRVQYLEDRDAARDRASDAKDRAHAADRAKWQTSLNDLLAEAKADAERDAALIAWLQSRGIRVPVGLISDRVDTDGDGKDDSDQVDRDAAQRERDARPKANPPKGGGSNGDGGGGSGGNGGQSHGHSGDSHGGSRGEGSSHSEDHSQGAEHRRRTGSQVRGGVSP